MYTKHNSTNPIVRSNCWIEWLKFVRIDSLTHWSASLCDFNTLAVKILLKISRLHIERATWRLYLVSTPVSAHGYFRFRTKVHTMDQTKQKKKTKITITTAMVVQTFESMNKLFFRFFYWTRLSFGFEGQMMMRRARMRVANLYASQ